MVKQCPFCGGDAKLIDCPESFNEGAVVVECQSCHASGPVVFGVKDDPKPHAIETWNRRDNAIARRCVEIAMERCRLLNGDAMAQNRKLRYEMASVTELKADQFEWIANAIRREFNLPRIAPSPHTN